MFHRNAGRDFSFSVMKYADKLKDPRWQKRRLEIMGRDHFKCCDCEAEDKTLAVHHLYYVSGREPWEYPDWSLSTLCESCHKQGHERVATQREEGSPCFEEWENIMSFLLGHRPLVELGHAWYFAAQVCQALGEGIDAKTLWNALEDQVMAMRQYNTAKT